jgi:hypothetical protein
MDGRQANIRLIMQWLEQGAPKGYTMPALMGELMNQLNDPPVQLPTWPVPVKTIIDEENHRVPPGTISYAELAAYEALGVDRHPRLDRMVGKLLVKPDKRAKYLAALERIKEVIK